MGKEFSVLVLVSSLGRVLAEGIYGKREKLGKLYIYYSGG